MLEFYTGGVPRRAGERHHAGVYAHKEARGEVLEQQQVPVPIVDKREQARVIGHHLRRDHLPQEQPLVTPVDAHVQRLAAVLLRENVHGRLREHFARQQRPVGVEAAEHAAHDAAARVRAHAQIGAVRRHADLLLVPRAHVVCVQLSQHVVGNRLRLAASLRQCLRVGVRVNARRHEVADLGVALAGEPRVETAVELHEAAARKVQDALRVGQDQKESSVVFLDLVVVFAHRRALGAHVLRQVFDRTLLGAAQ